MPDLSWDDEQIGGDETYTEEDLSSAEAMGKTPLGRFLCTCVESQPVMQNFDDYSCIAANLKWRVDRVLELHNVDSEKGLVITQIAGDETDIYIGKFLYDKINQYSPKEKEGMRNRRILVAKRTGLITDGSGTITKEMWKTGIIGKQTIITNEDSVSKKSGKVYRNVAFNGYESVTDAATAPTDDFEEI